jgi:drug/metabolite transporter (DMT)-like permease
MANFQGEIAALLAAFLWAISSVMYGRLGQTMPPIQLNLTKGVIAIALLILTIFISGDLFPVISPVSLGLLLLSGVLGIGVGDTAFFVALNCLGARRALLMETLAPPMTAVAALIFLQESLDARAWCGILLTIIGVAWVVTERVPDTTTQAPVNISRGVYFGLLAAFSLAIAAVMARAAYAHTSISPLWAALLRLSAGVFSLLPWIRWRQPSSQRLPSPRIMTTVFFAAFCGTYLGIWLQQTAIKLTAVGIASTLLQTSPLFILPIAFFLGEKISWRAIAGVIIAIAGVGVLFYLR